MRLRWKLYSVTLLALLNTDLSQDYFAFFGLKPQFNIDLNHLETQFREIQSAAHPDRFVTAPANERLASLQVATFANTAFTTLKAPDNRALYLLSLHNIEAVTETNTAMPADFLMQQMEWRETIEDAMLSKDIAKLDDLLIEMRDEANALIHTIAHMIDAQHNVAGAVDDVRKLVFMQKVNADIHRTIAQLEDA